MRAPIKLNPTALSLSLRRLARRFVASGDPTRLPELARLYKDADDDGRREIALAFSAAVSALKFGTTFKTTRPRRLEQSTRLIGDHLQGSQHVVVDVGASDASTTADLAAALAGRYDRLIAADLNVAIDIGRVRDAVAFFSVDGTPILIVSKLLLWYADTSGADPLSRAIVKRKFNEISTIQPRSRVQLINPRFASVMERDSRVEFHKHDVFAPLPFRATLIRIANLLNPAYFEEAQIQNALLTTSSALINGGLLLITRNDQARENGSLFVRRDAHLDLLGTVGAGSEVAHLVSRTKLSA